MAAKRINTLISQYARKKQQENREKAKREKEESEKK